MSFREYTQKRMEEDEKKKKNNQSSSDIIPFSVAKYQALVADYEDYNQRYQSLSGKYRDQASYDSMAQMLNSLDARKNSLNDYFSKRSYSDDFINQVNTGFKSMSDFSDSISKQESAGRKYFSQWKNEDEYEKAVESAKKREEMLSFDLEKGKKEIDELRAKSKSVGSKSGETNRKIAAEKRAHMKAPEQHKKYIKDSQKQKSQLDKTKAEIDDEIAKKQAYYNQAKVLQDNKRLVDNAINAKDFATYSAKGAKIGSKVDLPEYINEDETAIYNYYLAKEQDGLVKKGTANTYLKSIEDTLNQREGADTAKKLEGKTGLQLAFGVVAGLDQFGSGIKNTVEAIKGTEGYIAPSATQYASGMVRDDLIDDGFMLPKALGGSSVAQGAYDLITTTSNMMPSILASVAISAVATPAAGVSLNAAKALGVTSKVVGAGLMGTSAGGNAYQEMINLGYDKNQARTYAALTAASETGLQYALGGIGKLGGAVSGNITGKALEGIASGINSAAGQFAVKYGGQFVANMASEGLEEFLQDVLDPYFKSIATGQKPEKVDWAQAAYSGFLGALSAGLLDGVGAVRTRAGEVSTARYIRKEGKVDVLKSIGNTFSADTVAYKLAGKVDENTGAYTLSKMLHDVKANLSEQNQATIKNALMDEFITESDASKITKWLANAVEGGAFTKAQRMALDENPIISKVYRDVIVNQNSTVNQRLQGLMDVSGKVGKAGVDLDAIEERSSLGAISSSVQSKIDVDDYINRSRDSAIRQRFNLGTNPFGESAKRAVAEDAVRINSEKKLGIKTEDVAKKVNPETGYNVQKVEKIDNGRMWLKLENGSVVDSEDVVYANNDAALIYESSNALGYDAGTINAIVGSFNPSGALTASQYMLGVEEGINYGKIGINPKALYKGGLFGKLSDSQQRFIYNLGRDIAEKTTSEAQAKVDKAKSKSEGSDSKKKGRVTLPTSYESMTDRQKASVDAITKVVENVTHNNVVLYESVEKNGRRVFKENVANKLAGDNAPNGFYDPKTGTLYLDINAGNNGEGTVLWTAAHELAHFIKQWSPAKFKALADFLVGEYGKKGVNVDSLIQNQIAKANRNGRDLSYEDAFEEVVADSLSTMFTDTDLSSKLAKLKAQDKSLWNKIKEFFKDLYARITKAYEGLNPQTVEASYVHQMKNSIEKISDLFAEGIVDAGENFEQIKNTADGGVKYQLRVGAEADVEKALTDKNYTEDVYLTESSPSIIASQKGVKNLPMLMKASHIRENIFSEQEAATNGLKVNKNINYHGLGKELFLKIIDGLDDVNRAYRGTKNATDSSRREDYFLLISQYKDADGNTINVPVYINKKGQYNRVVMDTNKIATVFGKNGFNNYINREIQKGNLVKIKNRSIQASELTSPINASYSENTSVDTTVPQKPTAVNTHSMQNSEKDADEHRFSLRENVEETKDLIAVHNLTEAKMLKLLNLGGLPMPSIAIMKAKDANGNDAYGEISIVFDKNTISPDVNSKNKVYGGDVWSPVYPKIEYKLNEKKTSEIYHRAREATKIPAVMKMNSVDLYHSNIEDSINSKGLDALIEDYKKDYGMKQMFLAETGEPVTEMVTTEKRREMSQVEVEINEYLLKNMADELAELENGAVASEWANKYFEKLDNLRLEYFLSQNADFTEDFIRDALLDKENRFQKLNVARKAIRFKNDGAVEISTEDDHAATRKLIDERVDQDAYEAWLREMFDGVIEKHGIRNNVDLYAPNGNSRSFEALHYEETLENVVKQMKSQRNGDIAFFGGTEIWAVAAKNYGTFKALKADSHRLQSLTDEEHSAIKRGFGERFSEIANSILGEKSISGNYFIDIDNTYSNILEAVRSKKTKSGILSELKGYYGNHVTESMVDDILDLIADVGNMPTSYFEAKPQRAVGFDEVKFIVVPSNISEELKTALKGYNVVEYNADEPSSRVDALNSLDDVKFSDRDATMTEERIDYLINDSGAGMRTDYAQAWITSINPTDFLNLTLKLKNQDRERFDTMPGDYGSTVNDYDYIEGLKNEKRQTPYLAIDVDTNEVVGHEGRHRMRALEKQGITSCEIKVEFWDSDGRIVKEMNGYGNALEVIKSLQIYNQSGTGQSATIENIIPLNKSNRDLILQSYGKENSSIKYSDRDTETVEQINKQLQKENAKLKEDLVNVKELLAMQGKTTGGKLLKKTSVDAVARRLMRLNNATGNSLEFSNIIGDVYNYIVSGEEVVWEDISDRLDSAADWIMSNQKEAKLVRTDEAQEALNGLKKTKVKLTSTQKQEVALIYGSYENFRRAMFGKIIITDNANIDLDSMWDELCSSYPGYFNPETNEGDMVTELADKISDLQTSYIWDGQRELDRQQIKNEIYDGFWDVATLHTVADRNQQKVAALKNKHREQMDALRQSHADKVDSMQKENAERISRLRKQYQESSLKKQRAIMDRYAQSKANRKERRDKKILRDKIKKVVKDLNDYLLTNSKDKHVPQDMQSAVAEALDLINMDTVNADRRLNGYTDEDGTYHKGINQLIAEETDAEKLEALQEKAERIQNSDARLQEKIAKLRDAYNQFKDDNTSDFQWDSVVADMIDDVATSIKDTSIVNMSLSQLESVHNMYRMILKVIRDANKAFKMEKSATIAELGDSVIQETVEAGGVHKKFAKAGELVKKLNWNNLKPIYAVKAIGSDTLLKLFNNVRSGEDVWYNDTEEAKQFFNRTAKTYNYKNWDMGEQFSFTSGTGKEFKLNLQQIMSIYAYSKREQADEHLRIGGFVFDSDIEVTEKKKRIPIKYKVNTAEAHKIPVDTLVEIISKLTPEQKLFVDKMQTYLSKNMGAKGNEVSNAMYDIDLFKEENYFPLKSAKQFMFEQNEVAGEVRIKNSGFSKKTVQHANNPIILQDFMKVWSKHVNDMSMYHAFTLPIEDFNRVFNYRTRSDETVDIESVKTAIQNAYGSQATAYLRQMIVDLNGGIRSDPGTEIVNKMISVFKKGAVFASLSVIIQQPSAIGRAFAYISPKYFVRTIPSTWNLKAHKSEWAEVKKYAPVAGIKEMGYFDTHMGRQTTDWIMSEEYDTIKEKAKAIFKDSDYRDELLSKAPALADEIAWVHIWNAVKREVADKQHLAKGTEEHLRASAERFTEVIVNTQVYDSVLSRSGLMRSKDTGLKMATAFMAESTTSLNMLQNALKEGKRGNKQMRRREIGAVLASMILNSILVSFVYATRDDDDEKPYLEKYIGELTGSALDAINPLSLIPYVKDIISIVQGYDVERSDMAVVSALWNAWQQLQSENVDPYRKVEDFAGAIGNLFGLPVKNIMRDVRGIMNIVKTTMNGNQVTGQGILESFKSGIPFSGKSKKTDSVYNAIVAGEQDMVDRLHKGYDTEAKYHNAIRTGLKENDERITQAAQAKVDGNLSEYMSIVRSIKAEGKFSQDDIVAAVNSVINQLNKDEESGESEPKAKGIFENADIRTAIENGDSNMIDAIKQDLIDTAIANGKTQEKAEESAVTAVKNGIKDALQEGTISDVTASSALVNYADMESEDADNRVQYWNFTKDYPSVDISEAAVTTYYTTAEPAGISIDDYIDYYERKKECKGEDADGDGKTDSGSKKIEVLEVIDSLPISNYQKDVLYELNGWSLNKLYEAPWH